MAKRPSWDWRKEFARQHGRKPGAAHQSEAKLEPAKAPATNGSASPMPAEPRASAEPGGEASPGGATVNPSGPAEIIREEGESGAPQSQGPDVDPIAGESEEPIAMVEIGPNQFVNERSARALGLIPATSAMGRLIQGKQA